NQITFEGSKTSTSFGEYIRRVFQAVILPIHHQNTAETMINSIRNEYAIYKPQHWNWTLVRTYGDFLASAAKSYSMNCRIMSQQIYHDVYVCLVRFFLLQIPEVKKRLRLSSVIELFYSCLQKKDVILQ
ncbi:11752_t:CDS:1, partial [Ambispora leptoticha]